MADTLKAASARYGHIKRRLKSKQPLTGKHLELALDIVGDGNSGHEMLDALSNKLQEGQKLNDYELHLMLDVYLVHAKLANANSHRQEDILLKP
jgi:hypothetical protein